MNKKNEPSFSILGNCIVITVLLICTSLTIKQGGGFDASKLKLNNPMQNIPVSANFPTNNYSNYEDFMGNLRQNSNTETNQSENNKKPKLSDFNADADRNIDYTISYDTAISYFNVRPLSKTEILVFTEDNNFFGKYFQRNSNKKLVIFNNTNTKFLQDILKIKKATPSEKDFIFLHKDDTFLISDEISIKSTKDRIIYQLRKDCLNFCVINVPKKQFYYLKSPEVNQRTPKIIDVILKNM